MVRVIFALLAALLVIVAGGMLWLGAFPPQPQTQQVERVLPNDKFQPK